jgi:hypothetical protein
MFLGDHGQLLLWGLLVGVTGRCCCGTHLCREEETITKSYLFAAMIRCLVLFMVHWLLLSYGNDKQMLVLGVHGRFVFINRRPRDDDYSGLVFMVSWFMVAVAVYGDDNFRQPGMCSWRFVTNFVSFSRQVSRKGGSCVESIEKSM